MEIKHSEMVKSLVKSGEDIKNEVTAKELSLIHMILGLSGEAGELLDAIKKSVIYRRELDRVNVVEELGDIEFYLEGLRQELDISREECIKENINKLGVRYKGFQYSNKSAQDREDKV